MMKLYGIGPARQQRPRWVLQELGVAYEFVTVDLRAGEHRSPQFLELNPAGKIPVLVDGDRVITESVAISLYLAEKYPEGGLLPSDVWLRGQVYRWLFFAATDLEQPLWTIERHEQLYPESERVPAIVEVARREFRDMAQVSEDHLKGREYVVGDRVSVADFILAHTLDWGSEVGLLGDLPASRDYVERMYARPEAPPRLAELLAAMRRGTA
jgi:glutathione S-transferase